VPVSRERPAHRDGIKLLRRRFGGGKGEASAALLPNAERRFDFEIVFPTPAIGRQNLFLSMSREGFAAEIAPAQLSGFP